MLSTVHIKPLAPADFDIYSRSENVKVIRLLHQNVVTEKIIRKVRLADGKVDIAGTDLLKLAVVERHKATGNVGLGLIEGYGLKTAPLRSPFRTIRTTSSCSATAAKICTPR